MSENIQNSESETTDSVERQDTFHNPDRLINLTAWSAVLSWIFFVAGAAFVLVDLVFIIQTLPDISRDIMLWIIANLLLFVLGLICVFFGLILRMASEGISLLMDIEDNTRSK